SCENALASVSSAIRCNLARGPFPLKGRLHRCAIFCCICNKSSSPVHSSAHAVGLPSPRRSATITAALTNCFAPCAVLNLAKSAKLCVFSPRGNPVAVPLRLSRWSGGLGGRRRRTDSIARALHFSSIPTVRLVGIDFRHEQAFLHLRNRHGSRAIFTTRSNQLAFDFSGWSDGLHVLSSRRLCRLRGGAEGAEATRPVPACGGGHPHVLAERFRQPARAAVHGPPRTTVWHSGRRGDRLLRRFFRARHGELSDFHFHRPVWLR